MLEPGIGRAVIGQRFARRCNIQQSQGAIGAAEFIAHEAAHIATAAHERQSPACEAERIVAAERGILQVQRRSGRLLGLGEQGRDGCRIKRGNELRHFLRRRIEPEIGDDFGDDGGIRLQQRFAAHAGTQFWFGGEVFRQGVGGDFNKRRIVRLHGDE